MMYSLVIGVQLSCKIIKYIFLKDFFDNEIFEHCWVHLLKLKLHHMKYKKEWCLEDKDAGTSLSTYGGNTSVRILAGKK